MSQLDVTVVACRGVKGGGLFDKADPFVRVVYGGVKEKTHTDKDGGKNPNFNQTLVFQVGFQPYVLEVEVWDDDAGKDDFLANTIVDFKQALQYGHMSGHYPLRDKHGSDNGTVELKIQYRGPPQATHGQPPAGGAYGQPPAAYGQAPHGGAYGAPPHGSAYGQPPPGGAYGQPPPGGAYGGYPPAGAPYGQPQHGGAYGQPPPGGAYGQPPPGGAYGHPPPGGAYGQPPHGQPGYGYPPAEGHGHGHGHGHGGC